MYSGDDDYRGTGFPNTFPINCRCVEKFTKPSWIERARRFLTAIRILRFRAFFRGWFGG